MGRKVVEIFSGSRLVVGQMRGELKATDAGCMNLSAYYISRGAETHMQILWPLLQPPWHRAYLGSSLLRTCANPLR